MSLSLLLLGLFYRGPRWKQSFSLPLAMSWSPFSYLGSTDIVVALRQIPCQIQQQLFDFHSLNCFTFCQNGCKRRHCSCASLYPLSNQTTIDWLSWHKLFDLLSEWVQALALWLGFTRSLINSNNNCLIFMTYIVWPFVRVGASAAIAVALRYIPCQIQQQLFDFHDINCLTFCQSGCKHWPCGWATPTPCSTPSSTVSSTGKPHHHCQ